MELFEDHPSRYTADVNRRHRWIRGDWQIARWLLPHVPSANGQSVHNTLSALSRWKIFDNLRRSLVPISLVLILVGGWFAPMLLPSSAPFHRLSVAGITTIFALAVISLPVLLALILDLLPSHPI